jgi:hypothetical protein
MMSLSEIFFLVIVFYLLYRFVFNFLVPLIRVTKPLRQQFRNMREGMGERPQAQQASRPGEHHSSSGPGERHSSSRPGERHSSPKGPAEDYIDFEEVK